MNGTRVPVYATWQREIGPVLSLGVLTAAARSYRNGALEQRYEIRRPELAPAVLEHLATHDGPAVLLCSDYVWSLEANMDLARSARQLCPNLVVIHGGPSSPKYPADAESFLDRYEGCADVLVRGEGEGVIGPLLAAIADADFRIDTAALGDIAGLTFRDPSTGTTVRTADPERLADLDAFPSPYLTGEFDDIDPAAWHYCASIETNRGCPYGCSFCDWGSATLARIRSFSMERIAAELEWCARRGIDGVQICDANFGIMRRDVEVAARIADLRSTTGHPSNLSFTPAKNTSKHLTPIFDSLLAAGVRVSSAISLQTTDPQTLERVHRSNISTDKYIELARDLRQRGQFLQGDLLIGMPGQTYESYRADLQFFMDHEIAPRTWPVRMLPNAPMNDPDYRKRHQIRWDKNRLVVATESMSEADRERMLALRKAQSVWWRFGLLRAPMRVLQWDYGHPAVSVLELVEQACRTWPHEFPTMAWAASYFDRFLTVPNWDGIYAEARRLLSDGLGIGWTDDLDAAMTLQAAVMPDAANRSEQAVRLAHDYPRYLADAVGPLFETGRPACPTAPLAQYPPADVLVMGDLSDIVGSGMGLGAGAPEQTLESAYWVETGHTYQLPTTPQLVDAVGVVMAPDHAI